MATETRRLPLVVVAATVILVALTAIFLVNPGDQVARPSGAGVLEIVMENFGLTPSEFELPAVSA